MFAKNASPIAPGQAAVVRTGSNSAAPRWQGIHKGAAASLVGGAGSRDACQRFRLAGGVLSGVGGTRPPRLSPEGKRERGEIKFLAPQAISSLPLVTRIKFHFRFLALRCSLPFCRHASIRTLPGSLWAPVHVGIRNISRCCNLKFGLQTGSLLNRSTSSRVPAVTGIRRFRKTSKRKLTILSYQPLFI